MAQNIGWKAGTEVDVCCPKCRKVLVTMGLSDDGIPVVADLERLLAAGIDDEMRALRKGRPTRHVTVTPEGSSMSAEWDGRSDWQPRPSLRSRPELLRPGQVGAHTQKRGIGLAVAVGGESVDNLAHADAQAVAKRARAARMLRAHPGEGRFTFICRCGNRKWIRVPVLARLMTESATEGRRRLVLA